MGVRVTAPDGSEWEVARRLRWPRVPIAVAASVFLTRPWIVSAETVGVADAPRYREWRVRGFLRSRRAVREVAAELRRGARAEPEDAE